MAIFYDCALDKKRRFVTIKQVASMIRGAHFTFGGTWIDTNFEELLQLSKRWDLVA